MTNFEERAFLERALREHTPSKEIIFLPSGRELTRPLTAEYARKKIFDSDHVGRSSEPSVGL